MTVEPCRLVALHCSTCRSVVLSTHCRQTLNTDRLKPSDDSEYLSLSRPANTDSQPHTNSRLNYDYQRWTDFRIYAQMENEKNTPFDSPLTLLFFKGVRQLFINQSCRRINCRGYWKSLLQHTMVSTYTSLKRTSPPFYILNKSANWTGFNNFWCKESRGNSTSGKL